MLLRIELRDVVALADVVEREQLDHHVMHLALARLDQGEAVMARIDVHEAGRERIVVEVGDAEAQDVAIERQHLVDALDHHHHVADAERPGAESRDVARGLERLVGDLWRMEELHAVADRIVQRDEVGDHALRGQRPRPTRERDAVLLEVRAEPIEAGRIRHLPAVVADAFAAVGVDHHPLLPVVHAERQPAPRRVDRLEAEQVDVA